VIDRGADVVLNMSDMIDPYNFDFRYAGASVKAEQRQDEHDNHNETDEINYPIHVKPL
jgi:hypothetical protein